MSKSRQPRALPNQPRVFLPTGGLVEETGPVVRTKIVLLCPEREVAQNISVQQLAAFIQLVTARAQEILADSTTAFDLLLAITLHPLSAHKFDIFTSVEVDRHLLMRFYTSVAAVAPIYTREKPVAFQIEFRITAGDRS